MPKEPSTPTRSAARTTSESPRKRWTPKKPSAESLDESKWRDSKIKADKRLKKTDALEKYHLQPKDLEGLFWMPAFYDIPGKYFQGSKKMYLEREVEQCAWRRYGGPDGFAAYLTEAREHHTGTKPFRVPASYAVRKRADPRASIANVPKSLVPLKGTLERKAHGQPWLWDACNEAILAWGTGNAEWKLPTAPQRAKYLQAAIRDLPKYPPRIAAPLQLTHALQALRTVLDVAPVKGEDGEPVEHAENARMDELESGEVFWYWSTGYFSRVYLALHNVVLMDGVGPTGWGAARWMIYDEYSKWKGIEIDEKECKAWDNAYGWLQGRLPDDAELQLEFSAFEDQNSPPLSWSLLNAFLPQSLSSHWNIF